MPLNSGPVFLWYYQGPYAIPLMGATGSTPNLSIRFGRCWFNLLVSPLTLGKLQTSTAPTFFAISVKQKR